jgi:Phage gp6-like head-tail connector protein
MMLKDVKTLLGIESDDLDDKLKTLIEMTKQRLCRLLKTDYVPSDLEYIVVEVTVRRYNQIGSEGMDGHTVQGETISFSSNIFSDFMDEINAWKDEQSRGLIEKVNFI